MALLSGLNLHALATSVTGTSVYTLKKWAGRTKNDYGEFTSTYEEEERKTGTVKPLSMAQIINYGLDASKNYICIHDSYNFTAVNQDKNPDQVLYDLQGNGNPSLFKIQPNKVSFYNENGWSSTIWVQISDD